MNTNARLLLVPVVCALTLTGPAALAARPATGPTAVDEAAVGALLDRASQMAREHSAAAAKPGDAGPIESVAIAASVVPAESATQAPERVLDTAALPGSGAPDIAEAQTVPPGSSSGREERPEAGTEPGTSNSAAPVAELPATATTAHSGTSGTATSPVTGRATPNGPSAANSPADFVIVTLSSPAAAYYDGGIRGLAATRSHGRFDATSAAYASYRKHLDNEHASFRAALARVAAGAQVIRDYRITANAVAVYLNGADASVVARINGVNKVYPVTLYRPTMNQSVGLIDLDDAWNTLGRDDAGEGVRVGVLDSGILMDWDETTPNPLFACKQENVEFGGVFFSGVTGAPALFNVGELPVPSPGVLFVEPHGTHVAGTIGGCVTTIADGSFWDGIELSGVAPAATLVDYNVFPGIGAGYVGQDGSAFSHDIAAAIETAVGNGDHVINMSLSGGVQGPHDFLAEVAEGAVAAGVVVVAAVGNSGASEDEEDEDGTEYSVGSPASAASVIGVGATTTTRGVRIAIKGEWDEDADEDLIAAFAGDFDLFDGNSYYIIDWPGSDNLACVSDVTDDSLTGAVVLIQRGSCSFSQKIENAKRAGAGGVIVYANSDEIIKMARSEGFDDDIPAVFIAQEDGETLEGASPLEAVITGYEEYATDPDLLADFSSRGPVPFTGIIKPDVVAPGVNILSSTFTGFELYDGTSMATPHVAGASAVLLDMNPDWTPAQVKSALATTATDLGLKPWQQGSGLIQVDKALATNAFFAPTNASFGIFTGKAPANGVIAIALSTAATCEVASISGEASGVNVDASISGATLNVSFDAGRTAPGGLYGGMVKIACDAQTHTVPWAAVVNR